MLDKIDYKNKSFNVEVDANGNIIYSRPRVKVLLACHACKKYTDNRRFNLCEDCNFKRRLK
tara:strand:- start:1172 stop:1354 length:183 start_codon:yes stop_codon:yes gene_type:complete